MDVHAFMTLYNKTEKGFSPPQRFGEALLDFRCAKWVQARKPKDPLGDKHALLAAYHLLLRLHSLI